MPTQRSLLEGLGAGAIGYAVVAGFFALVNVLTGVSPFHTAYLIGETLGAGTAGPGDAAGIVLAANGIHLLLSLGLGVVAAWLVLDVERYHDLWYVVLLVFVTGFMGMVVVAGIAGAELTGVATWGEVAGASVLFAGAVGGFLGWRHRALSAALGRELSA